MSKHMNKIALFGMSYEDEICSKCFEESTEWEDVSIFRSELSKIEINSKFTDSEIDVARCLIRIERFTFEVLAQIQQTLKREIEGEDILILALLSAQCMTFFSKF